MSKPRRPIKSLAAAVLMVLAANAQSLSLSSVSASFSQELYSASFMINGVVNGDDGWAIYRFDGQADQSRSESALFVLGSPLSAGSYDLSFTLRQIFVVPTHLLGHFGFGYVTDVAPTLASAATSLPVLTAASLNGTTFSLVNSGEVLAGGPLPAVDVYTIGARLTSAAPVTGIVLRVLNDPSMGLPTGGPGRASNGNFVITEFEMGAAAVPEPASYALLLAGLVALRALTRFRKD